MRRLAAVAACLACLAGLAGAATSASASTALPRVRHVFVIVLENQGYAATFGSPSADPYLAQTLPAEGALLQNYYATGHESNDNYVSLVSGQPPNAQNQADCPRFDNFSGAMMLSSGVEAGTGCVYPAEVQNIGTQLTAAKHSWKAYMEDMGNEPNREAAACGHPAVEATDETQKAVAGDGYATRHDPFVYFHSVIDTQAFCDKHVVALGSPSGQMPPSALRGETGLATDLAHPTKTPMFSFITPNLCNDGHDFPCTNQPGGASGWPTSTPSWKRGCRRSPPRRATRRAGCWRSSSTRPRAPKPKPAAKSSRAPARRCRASPVRAAAASAPCLSRRSSNPAR
jgi:hypothetical protein